jgi:5-hydroxyisourate hydrolase-like protein (transthyretin family)
MRPIGRMGRVALLLLLAAGTAAAGTVTGTVLNGTSGKPAAGVDVILIQLQGGMEPVANTKTDAQGK